jgi:hypothetical protein
MCDYFNADWFLFLLLNQNRFFFSFVVYKHLNANCNFDFMQSERSLAPKL